MDMNLLIIIEYAGWLAAAVAVITMPMWCFRSMTRYRMWRVRDMIAMDLATGELPRCPESARLLREAEKTISISTRLTLLRVQIFDWVARSMSEDDWKRLAALHEPDLAGLEDVYADRIRLHYERVRSIERWHVVFGSWLGLFVLLIAAVIAFVQVVSHVYREWSHHTDRVRRVEGSVHPVRVAARRVVDREFVDEAVPAFVGSSAPSKTRELAQLAG